MLWIENSSLGTGIEKKLQENPGLGWRTTQDAQELVSGIFFLGLRRKRYC